MLPLLVELIGDIDDGADDVLPQVHKRVVWRQWFRDAGHGFSVRFGRGAMTVEQDGFSVARQRVDIDGFAGFSGAIVAARTPLGLA